MKYIPLLILLCFRAAAQDARVLFYSHSESSYHKGSRPTGPKPVEHLLIFKSREVRYNDRLNWEDEVFSVASIESKKRKQVYMYDCGLRTYAIDFKHHQVEMFDRQTSTTTIYNGDIVPYEARENR